jgi:hypothetical protein
VLRHFPTLLPDFVRAGRQSRDNVDRSSGIAAAFHDAASVRTSLEWPVWVQACADSRSATVTKAGCTP